MERAELWIPIKGFPGYQISSHGRVRSLDRITTGFHKKGYKGRIRKFGSINGYSSIQIRKEGRRYDFLVHRLMLENFVGPCPPGKEACHFPDPDRKNCCIWNLRWDTRKKNHADKILHGTTARGSRNPNCKLTEDQVREIRRRCRLDGANQHDLGREFGVNQSVVSNIVRRKVWAWLK